MNDETNNAMRETAEPSVVKALVPIRTPDQMEWIRDRYNPPALQRLARSTPDYYEHKGSYLPDVSALAYVEWDRAERAESELRDEREMAKQVIETLRDLSKNWEDIIEETVEGEPLIENILYWAMDDLGAFVTDDSEASSPKDSDSRPVSPGHPQERKPA